MARKKNQKRIEDVSDTEIHLENLKDLDKTEIESLIDDNLNLELIEDNQKEGVTEEWRLEEEQEKVGENQETIKEKQSLEKSNSPKRKTKKVEPTKLEKNTSVVETKNSKSLDPKKEKSNTLSEIEIPAKQLENSSENKTKSSIKVRPKSISATKGGIRSTLGLFHR